MEYPKKRVVMMESTNHRSIEICKSVQQEGSGRSLWASRCFCETKQTIQKSMNEASKMNGKTQKNNKEKNTLTKHHFFDV